MGFFNSFWNRRTAINTGRSAKTLKSIEREMKKANEPPTVKALPGESYGRNNSKRDAREQTKSAAKLAKQYRRDGTIH